MFVAVRHRSKKRGLVTENKYHFRHGQRSQCLLRIDDLNHFAPIYDWARVNRRKQLGDNQDVDQLRIELRDELPERGLRRDSG
jgi:hypothetical protein